MIEYEVNCQLTPEALSCVQILRNEIIVLRLEVAEIKAQLGEA